MLKNTNTAAAMSPETTQQLLSNTQRTGRTIRPINNHLGEKTGHISQIPHTSTIWAPLTSQTQRLWGCHSDHNSGHDSFVSR